MRRSATVASMVVAGVFCANHAAQAFQYKFDDGTAERSFGVTEGGSIIAINAFPTTSGNSTIGSISAVFGNPFFPNEASLLGTSFTVALYSSTSLTSLTSAILLTTATGTVTSVDGNVFITVPITPTTITTPDFLIAYSVASTGAALPAALDNDTAYGRSFVAGDFGGDPVNLANLAGNDIPPSNVNNLGFNGNWLLRADTVPEPSTYAMMGIGFIALGATLRLRRRIC